MSVVREYKDSIYQYKIVKEREGDNTIALQVIRDRIKDLEKILDERGILHESEYLKYHLDLSDLVD